MIPVGTLCLIIEPEGMRLADLTHIGATCTTLSQRKPVVPRPLRWAEWCYDTDVGVLAEPLLHPLATPGDPDAERTPELLPEELTA
jgi:hypothetical protein